MVPGLGYNQFDPTSNPLYYGAHLYVNGTEIKDLVIPEGVEYISRYSFFGCTGLTSVTFPKSLKVVGSRAFEGCTNLKKVNITNLADWCNIDFRRGSVITHVYETNHEIGEAMTSNPLAVGANLYIDNQKLTDIVIPEGVTSIQGDTFYGYTDLESVTLPDGITSIGSYAFAYCSNMKSINIPNTITSIGYKAFYNCESLSTVVVPNNVTDIGYRAFYKVPHIEYYGTATSAPWGALAMNGKNYEVYTEYNAATQTLTYYYDAMRESRSDVTELYDPNTVRFADYYNKVQKAVIDESMQNAPLTSMKMLFYGGFSMRPLYLSAMTSIEGLENLNTYEVTSMQSMFEGCQSLTELDLSTFNTANVTSMNCMFQSCSNLETLNIALFNIGKMEDMRYMFSGCSKLKTIYCNSDWSTSGAQSSYMFSGCSALEGGQGTKFNSSVIDKTYARIDNPTNDKPGYFTVVESVAVTIGAREWATFVAPYALDFSDVDGLTAYIITGHTGSTVETVEVSDVPANTPVLLNGSANTYTIPVITGSATDVSGNKLVAGTGAKVSAEAGKTKYVLSTEADDVVFKIITETPATVAKSKAYLMFDEVVESRQLTFGHDVTGIESSPESSFEGKNLWYDLQGRRLEGMPTRKGLYIVNGKKYLVK